MSVGRGEVEETGPAPPGASRRTATVTLDGPVNAMWYTPAGIDVPNSALSASERPKSSIGQPLESVLANAVFPLLASRPARL